MDDQDRALIFELHRLINIVLKLVIVGLVDELSVRVYWCKSLVKQESGVALGLVDGTMVGFGTSLHLERIPRLLKFRFLPFSKIIIIYHII